MLRKSCYVNWNENMTVKYFDHIATEIYIYEEKESVETSRKWKTISHIVRLPFSNDISHSSTSMLYINFKFWECTIQETDLLMVIERVFLKGFVYSHDYILDVDMHFFIKTLLQVRAKNLIRQHEPKYFRNKKWKS